MLSIQLKVDVVAFSHESRAVLVLGECCPAPHYVMNYPAISLLFQHHLAWLVDSSRNLSQHSNQHNHHYTVLPYSPSSSSLTMSLTPDPKILQRCVELAREALEAGDDPFGSVLVSGDGKIIREDRNRVNTGENGDGKRDGTLHPEFTLARWAQLNLSAGERAKASVYTSGEHCPMCAAAHAWVGLGPIVYVSSSAQFAGWLEEFGLKAGAKVKTLPINDVAPSIAVQGPIPGLDEEVKALHKRRFQKSS